MPRLAWRWAIACCILASLLAGILWICACAPFEPGTPPAAVPAGPEASQQIAPAPADFGCLVYQGHGADQPVWLLEGARLPRLLTQASWSQISPDGRAVAYIRGFPAEVWVTDNGDSGEQHLYTAPMGNPLIDGLVLAPSGSVAVFGLSCPGCPASQDPGVLQRLDMPTGTVRQVADHGAHWPLFSPDGKWLSVASPLGTLASHGSVGLIDLEGRGTLALFDHVLVRDRAWAADSSGFVVALDPMAPPQVATELWWIPVVGGRVQLGRLAEVADLSWQPGGQRLVYRKWVNGGPTTWLVMADRDGSQEVPILGSEGMAPRAYGQLPSWSPGGHWLITMREDGSHSLLEMDRLRLHPIEAQVVYGWLDAEHYLASLLGTEDLARYQRGEEMLLDLHRCVPLGSCEWLARIPRQAHLSYASHCP